MNPRLRLRDIDSRLDRLYDALETSKLDLRELAPRIRDLISHKKDLQQAIAEVQKSGCEKQINDANVNEIKCHVDDLKVVLNSAFCSRAESFSKELCEKN